MSGSSVFSPKPTYAETLLAKESFTFHTGENSYVDLAKIRFHNPADIVNENDVKTLQTLVPDVVFGELNVTGSTTPTFEEVARLFRLSQLISQYLLHVQDTLAENINSIAAKYVGLKKKSKASLAVDKSEGNSDDAFSSSNHSQKSQNLSRLEENGQKAFSAIHSNTAAWVEVCLPQASTVEDLGREVLHCLDMEWSSVDCSVWLKGVELKNTVILDELSEIKGGNEVPFVVFANEKTKQGNAHEWSRPRVEGLTEALGIVVEELKDKINASKEDIIEEVRLAIGDREKRRSSKRLRIRKLSKTGSKAKEEVEFRHSKETTRDGERSQGESRKLRKGKRVGSKIRKVYTDEDDKPPTSRGRDEFEAMTKQALKSSRERKKERNLRKSVKKVSAFLNLTKIL